MSSPSNFSILFITMLVLCSISLYGFCFPYILTYVILKICCLSTVLQFGIWCSQYMIWVFAISFYCDVFLTLWMFCHLLIHCHFENLLFIDCFTVWYSGALFLINGKYFIFLLLYLAFYKYHLFHHSDVVCVYFNWFLFALGIVLGFLISKLMTYLS